MLHTEHALFIYFFFMFTLEKRVKEMKGEAKKKMYKTGETKGLCI